MPEWTLYLGSDHRGFEVKQDLIAMLGSCHTFLKVKDLGPDHLDPDDDFNDAAIAVSKAVLKDEHGLGILLCGSAHGVTMQANRFKGIRAINAGSVESAVHGRENDHANVLCLSADYLDADAFEPIIKAFCHSTPKSDEKYLRRAKRLDSVEENS